MPNVRFLAPLALTLFAACAATNARPPIDMASSEVVDLSYAFDEKTLYWPSSPSSFELERLSYGKTAGGFFYSSNAYSAPEHGGTHLDAPIHFAEGQRTVDQIPPGQLMAPAVVIDVTAQTAADAD